MRFIILNQDPDTHARQLAIAQTLFLTSSHATRLKAYVDSEIL